jgi:flagellar biogenesis protein FliO
MSTEAIVLVSMGFAALLAVIGFLAYQVDKLWRKLAKIREVLAQMNITIDVDSVPERRKR